MRDQERGPRYKLTVGDVSGCLVMAGVGVEGLGDDGGGPLALPSPGTNVNPQQQGGTEDMPQNVNIYAPPFLCAGLELVIIFSTGYDANKPIHDSNNSHTTVFYHRLYTTRKPMLNFEML